MIQKLIDYITSKIQNLEITESPTNSRYIKVNSRKVRISDHLGIYNDKIDISILIPEESSKFIVSIGHKIYLYDTLRQTGDLIINYIQFNSNIFTPYKESAHEAYRTKQSQVDAERCLVKNQHNSEKAELKTEIGRLSSQIYGLTRKTMAMEKENKTLKKEAMIKDDTIKEAADIIEELTTNPEARQLIYNQNTEKTYYLDNFSEDAREMIFELIKEYYSK